MISRNHHTIARTVGADHEPVRGELRWARAACRDHDPDLWIPEGAPAADSAVWDEPRSICATCPMRDECLKDAIDRKETWGMWGGKTPQELAKLVKRPCHDCGRNPARPGRSYCTACNTNRRRKEARRFTITACLGCHREMRIKARGLCSYCYKARRNAGTLGAPMTASERAETAFFLRQQGMSTEAIAARLDVHPRSVERYFAKAKTPEQVAS